MTKRTLLILATATLLVMGGLGLLIVPWSRGVSAIRFLSQGWVWWQQLLIGLLVGWLLASIALWIIQMPYLKKVNAFFGELFKSFNLSLFDIFWISICAGIGEEMFFRGAIQPYLGIALTSFLFVLLHGYINPFNRPLTAYGLFMVLAIGLLGVMTEEIGIISAITAHAMIDFILLLRLARD